MSALAVLRHHVLHQLPVVLLNHQDRPVETLQEAASFQLSGGQKFATNTVTQYKDTTATKAEEQYLPLNALYFAWLTRDDSYVDYFRKSGDLSLRVVPWVDRPDVIAYFTDAAHVSANIPAEEYAQVYAAGPAPAGSALATKADAPDATTWDSPQCVGQIVNSERIIVDRFTITKCRTTKTFEGLRQRAVALVTRKKPSSKMSGPGGPVKSQKQSSSSAASSHKSLDPKDRVPIIIIPNSSQSLLSLQNIKSFFEEFKFVPQQQLSGQKPQFVDLRRPDDSIPDRKQRSVYRIYDTVDRLRGPDWDRVVAVFTAGQTWQFKNWPAANPVDIFSKFKGFHLKYDGESTDSNVAQWDVSVLTVHRSKRHLDKQCALEFWKMITTHVKNKKPQLKC